MPTTTVEPKPSAARLEARRETRPAGPGAPMLCFCGQDWWYHNRAHSDFQLMTRIAGDRKVLLVNSIGMRMPTPGKSTVFFKRVLRKLASIAKLLRRPLEERPDYWVMTPLPLPFYSIGWVRRFGAWFVRMQVRAACKWIGIDKPDIFVTVPTALPVALGMDRRSLIYNRSDKHSEFGEADQSLVANLERGLFREADFVLYVSRELMSEESSLTEGRARFLDHGVDVEHFRHRGPHEEPSDLRAIPRPRIGFFGGLDDYTVDFDLLEKVARELPEAQLVLVGRAMCSMERFASIDNVHFLDFKSYAEIPRYGSFFDVALMPWQRNEWIRHCNPIKLKEYLALGLPIVSTDFPEVRYYEKVVRIGASPDDFVEHVRRTIADGGPSTPEERRAIVAESTWNRRTEELLQLVDTRS